MLTLDVYNCVMASRNGDRGRNKINEEVVGVVAEECLSAECSEPSDWVHYGSHKINRNAYFHHLTHPRSKRIHYIRCSDESADCALSGTWENGKTKHKPKIDDGDLSWTQISIFFSLSLSLSLYQEGEREKMNE